MCVFVYVYLSLYLFINGFVCNQEEKMHVTESFGKKNQNILHTFTYLFVYMHVCLYQEEGEV